MASLPARQPSQRRAPDQMPASQSEAAQSPPRARSEDSQTIFLQQQEEEEEEQEKGDASQGPSTHAPGLPHMDDPSIKRCWICFADEDEDTPETSTWRDPCPCALVAHEECLLDWIADIEAPRKSRNNPSLGLPKIQCPQCKSEIKLARPNDYVVNTYRGLEGLAGKLITPGALVTLSGVLWSSSVAWGIHSIYAIFGPEDGFRILRPIIYNTTRAPIEVYVGAPAEAGKHLLGLVFDHLRHWRLYLGLPLITPVLILSRTSFADGILPVLPIVFFASQAHSTGDTLDIVSWPPSASFAFAMLPYIRSFYNILFQKMWAEREARWLKEVQPRTAQVQQDADEDVPNANPGAAAGEQPQEGDNVFEVRIDGGMWDDWEDENPAQQPRNNFPVLPPEQQAVQDALAVAPAQGGQAAAPQQEGNQPDPAAAGARRLSFSPTAIAETIVGALAFPTIAGLSGELLKLVLPLAWTTPPQFSPRFHSKAAARGLLQYKWGRSLVGGCLFVIFKDALTLYVRWKMAQMHRGRRVVDFDRKKAARHKPSTPNRSSRWDGRLRTGDHP